MNSYNLAPFSFVFKRSNSEEDSGIGKEEEGIQSREQPVRVAIQSNHFGDKRSDILRNERKKNFATDDGWGHTTIEAPPK